MDNLVRCHQRSLFELGDGVIILVRLPGHGLHDLTEVQDRCVRHHVRE